jgi:hypothetical protein
MPLGSLRTTLDSLTLGDYIECEYTASSGVLGTFANLGAATKSLLPASGSAAPNGKFNFICVKRNSTSGIILIADRLIQISIKPNLLIKGKYQDGKLLTLGGKNILMRIPTGGTCGRTTTNTRRVNVGIYKGWPTSNEYDTYISDNTLGGKITAGDNAIWNLESLYTFCQENLNVSLNTTYYMVYRGSTSNRFEIGSWNLDNTNSIMGFRPVLIYKYNNTIW